MVRVVTPAERDAAISKVAPHLRACADAALSGLASFAILYAGPEPVSGVAPHLGCVVLIVTRDE